jgi:DNA-binding transcriptional LysR family regulator
MLDLAAIKDFLVLCQTKNFSRAAERCHVSVSGLSRRIQGVESWLGTPAFERGKTSLELTDAGRQLQSVATEVTYALEGLRKSVRHTLEDRNEQIRFAAPHVMSAIFFPEWIPRLHSEFKSARFNVASDNLPECRDALNSGEADFLVTLIDAGHAILEHTGLRGRDNDYPTIVLGTERLIPVCAPDAAGRALFPLEGSCADPISFLGYSGECSLGWALDHALLSFPLLNLARYHQSSLADGLRAMALSRLGVAWLPETMVRNELSSKILMRAGGSQFDVPLKISILRNQARLGSQADAFWLRLATSASAMTSNPQEILVA